MTQQPDLWSLPVLPYNGSSGAVVKSDTSRDRAAAEDANGTTTARQRLVLDILANYADGLTWREAAAAVTKFTNGEVNLHHGQISGVLSVLHKHGLVYTLRAKRNGSHPYVDARWRHIHQPNERIDSPTKTLAGSQRAALSDLLNRVDEYLLSPTPVNLNALGRARGRYRDVVE